MPNYDFPSSRKEVRDVLVARRKRRTKMMLIALAVGLFLLAVFIDKEVLTCENWSMFCPR